MGLGGEGLGGGGGCGGGIGAGVGIGIIGRLLCFTSRVWRARPVVMVVVVGVLLLFGMRAVRAIVGRVVLLGLKMAA